LNLSPLVVDEITVLGSRCGPFSEALAALAQGTINLDGLVTAEFALAEGVKALAAAERPDALKVLLRC
jgi:threonine dehydrogenase-like Zn-dependent dehydrogenase